MTGKDHNKLLRDIRGYVKVLTEAKVGLSDFFIESSYKDGSGKENPCYELTRKDRDMVANKMTGEAFNELLIFVHKKRLEK